MANGADDAEAVSVDAVNDALHRALIHGNEEAALGILHETPMYVEAKRLHLIPVKRKRVPSDAHRRWTLLHAAAAHASARVVHALLAAVAGCSETLDMIDTDKTVGGMPPIMYAARRGARDVVEVLLAAGADATVRARSGRTALHEAALRTGDDALALWDVLAVHCDPLQRDHDGWSPVQLACGKDNAAMLERVVARELGGEGGGEAEARVREALLRVDNRGRTPLFTAAAGGAFAVVQRLVALAPAAVHMASATEGRYPLHKAAFNGFPRVVRCLLEHGARVDVQDGHGRTPLYTACLRNRHEVLRMLLDVEGSGVMQDDTWGETPLHAAASMGGLESVELLLAAGADVNALNNQDTSPLRKAAWNGHRHVMEALLAHGATLEADASLPPLLFIAMEHPSVVELLVERGVDVDVIDAKGFRVLHWCVQRGYVGAVQKLCQARLFERVPVNAPTPAGNTALHMAVAHPERSCKLTAALLAHPRIDHSMANGTGATPLLVAVSAQNEGTAKMLLEHGAGADVADEHGVVPLHVAARGDVALVRTLLAHGAVVDVSDNHGTTALHEACANGHTKCAAALIEASANVHAQDVDGMTPALRAVVSGKDTLTLLQMLLTASDTVLHARDKHGNSAMHLCISADAARKRKVVLAFLAERGLSINDVNTNGWTPLMFAAKERSLSMSLACVEMGADPTARDVQGETATSIAAIYGFAEYSTSIFGGAGTPGAVALVESGGAAALRAACPYRILTFDLDPLTAEEAAAPTKHPHQDVIDALLEHQVRAIATMQSPQAGTAPFLYDCVRAGMCIEEPPALDAVPLLWVDSEDKLAEMIAHLNEARVIGIDLEHWSVPHTSAGATCLMQVSTHTRDFLVDTIVVREHLHALNAPFANERIVKVLHGGDSDVLWMQRDFRLFCVNVFDTGRAARALRYPKHSLAYLLKRFLNMTVEKKYQRADWRVRPLPDEMELYGRMDSHYLPFLFEQLVTELQEVSTPKHNVLLSVMQKSSGLSRRLYTGTRYRLTLLDA